VSSCFLALLISGEENMTHQYIFSPRMRRETNNSTMLPTALPTLESTTVEDKTDQHTFFPMKKGLEAFQATQ
jgi:hypothetical protein